MPKRNSPRVRRWFVAAVFFPAFLLFSSTLMGQDKQPVVLELDHVTVCGSNLDALRQVFNDIGLTSDFGGPHGNGVTQMALVGFDDQSYIELIAPVTPGVTAGSEWARFLGDEAVTCAWGAETNVLLQELERLKKMGVPVTEPKRGSRKRPDGMNLEWMTAQIGSGTAGSVLPFMIEDQTPRTWRVQTSASVKGAPIFGVESVIVGVSNLDDGVALFRKTYNWSEPIIENQKDFGKLAYFPGEPVILAAPSGGNWLADRLSKYGEGPVAYLLGTRDYTVAGKKYKLSGPKVWFGQRVGWFDSARLKGVRLGVIGQ